MYFAISLDAYAPREAEEKAYRYLSWKVANHQHTLPVLNPH